MRKAAKRTVSLLAAVALVFSLGAPVLAEGVPDEGQPCPAHTQHDSECGFMAGAEASPCTHEHDAECGFVEAVEGADCIFVHEHVTEGENACGYNAEIGEGCTYDPASHTHDESCGYVAAVEAKPCGHEHNEECGFAEEVEAVPCTHACELCAPALPPDNGPLMAPTALNGAAPMALPVAGLGQPWDGIDFTALAGSGIYFGQYAHATDLSDNTEAAAPVLWRVMGEEGSDGNLTLLSEYVLDSSRFDDAGTSNVYEGSTIQTKLAAMYSGGMFETWEKPLVIQTDVSTGMYTFGTETELTGAQGNGASYPNESADQYLYLPWGTYTSSGETVFWTAGNDIQNQYAIYRNSTGTENIAYLRGGGSVPWWLRSPVSFYSDIALYVLGSGGVNLDVVSCLGRTSRFQAKSGICHLYI